MRARTEPCTNWRGEVTYSSCFDPLTLFHDASATTHLSLCVTQHLYARAQLAEFTDGCVKTGR